VYSRQLRHHEERADSGGGPRQFLPIVCHPTMGVCSKSHSVRLAPVRTVNSHSMVRLAIARAKKRHKLEQKGEDECPQATETLRC
jgi:hypothetical protein